MARNGSDDKRKYGSMAASYGRKKPKPSAGGSAMTPRRKGPNMAATKPTNQIPYGERPISPYGEPKRRTKTRPSSPYGKAARRTRTRPAGYGKAK